MYFTILESLLKLSFYKTFLKFTSSVYIRDSIEMQNRFAKKLTNYEDVYLIK